MNQKGGETPVISLSQLKTGPPHNSTNYAPPEKACWWWADSHRFTGILSQPIRYLWHSPLHHREPAFPGGKDISALTASLRYLQILLWYQRQESLPHLIVSTTTKGSALSSRNPIPSPHWLEAIDGWKEGAMQPIRKRDGEAESTKRQKWREARCIVFTESRGIGEIFVKPHSWTRTCRLPVMIFTLQLSLLVPHFHKGGWIVELCLRAVSVLICGRSGKDTNGSFKRLTSHLKSCWCLFLRQHLKSWLSGCAECFFSDADGFKLLRFTFPLANPVAPFALRTDCDSSDSSTDNDNTHGTWAATRAADYRISFQWLICGLRPRIRRGYLFMSAFLFKLSV